MNNNSIKNQLIRIVIGLGLWLLSGIVIYLSSEVPRREPTENFLVCVVENNQPTLLNIEIYQQQPKALCQQEFRDLRDGYNEIELKKINEIWQLKTWGDSMGDPVVYFYKINGQKIEPLYWSHGENGRRMSGFMLGGILSLFLYQIFKFFAKRTQKLAFLYVKR
ncbi:MULTISPECIES: hypothetical protein [unclassified Acinetobacter]|uniref:hypothetical protein n=1 Tax=unclassified Acinetobacter TaxID=196816 RepID=UPI0035B80B1D